MSAVLDAVAARQSWSKVTDDAPGDDELLRLIAAAGRVADHSSLRPWRIITLRGDDRDRLGRALNRAAGEKGTSSKPMRAPLLLAVVFSRRPSGKVPSWEQEAVASGVAHVLSLLLDDAGWGVLWRTGEHVRTKPVAEVHGLAANEQLMGWLYVGGKPEGRSAHRKSVDAAARLSALPSRRGETTDTATIAAQQSRLSAGPVIAAQPKDAGRVKTKKKRSSSGAGSEPRTHADKLVHKAEKAQKKAVKAARKAAIAQAETTPGAPGTAAGTPTPGV